jgi:hypothetical protein
MQIYLYLSLYPESLIASMLPPEEFGRYLSIGTKKRVSRQEAIFFELDSALCAGEFDLSDLSTRCVPHADGEPKHTVYYSIYRVLERVPLRAFKDMYLTTRQGKVLVLRQNPSIPEFKHRCFYYQEIIPVHPSIVSSLDPVAFSKFITDKSNKLYVPKICFVDLRLGELADDPDQGSAADLPYSQLDNLRKCLVDIKNLKDKHTKTVDRIHPQYFLYRTIQNGFFIGSAQSVLYYPFPAEKELNSTYYEWWRSATQ